MKERDQDLPSTRQRLFNKYSVVRVDGKVDHEGAKYFVIRCDGLGERPADRAALSAYVTAVHPTHPLLAADLAKFLPAVDLKDARRVAAKAIGQLLPTNYSVVSGIGEVLAIQDASGEVVGSFAWEGPQDTTSIVATVWSMHAATLAAQSSDATTYRDQARTTVERLQDSLATFTSSFKLMADFAAEQSNGSLVSDHFTQGMWKPGHLPRLIDQLREANRQRVNELAHLHTTLAEVEKLKSYAADLDQLYQQRHEAMVAAGLPRGCTTIEKVCDWIRAQAPAASTGFAYGSPEPASPTPHDVLRDVIAAGRSPGFVSHDFSPKSVLRQLAANSGNEQVRVAACHALLAHAEREPTIVRLPDNNTAQTIINNAPSEPDPRAVAAQYLLSMPPGFIIHFANKCDDGTECATRWTWSAPESQASSSDFAEPLLALEDAWMRYGMLDRERANQDLFAALRRADVACKALYLLGMPKDCKDFEKWAEVHADGYKTVQAALTKFVTVYEVDGAKVKNLAELEQMCDAVSERDGIPVMARTYHPECGQMVTVTIPKVSKERRDGRYANVDERVDHRLALADIAKRFPQAKNVLAIDPYAITYGGVECDSGELQHMTVVNSDVPHSATQDRAEVVVLVGRDGSLDVHKNRFGSVGVIVAGWEKTGTSFMANARPDPVMPVDGPTPVKAPSWTGITWTSRKGKAKSVSLPGLKITWERNGVVVMRQEGHDLTSAAIRALDPGHSRQIGVHVDGRVFAATVISVAVETTPGAPRGHICVRRAT